MPTVIDSFRGEYRFLSNFWPVRVTLFGTSFPTVEHAYQWAKTDDPTYRERIASAATAGAAKRLGKRAPIRDNWDDVRLDIMRQLIRDKFRGADLAHKLVATMPADLVEGNDWHDDFWGDCRCPKHASKPGINHLGNMLMDERLRLLETGAVASEKVW